MRQLTEHGRQSSVDTSQPVPVQPQVDQSPVERQQCLGEHGLQRAVVQIQSRRDESAERVVLQADVLVAVEEQML